MKTGIHPEYKKTTITCACGASFETGSTATTDLRVEICSKCHPFYTGTRGRLIDTGGRVERFRRKFHLPDDEA